MRDEVSVRMLLDRGADPTLTGDGKSLLQICSDAMRMNPQIHEPWIRISKMLETALEQKGIIQKPDTFQRSQTSSSSDPTPNAATTPQSIPSLFDIPKGDKKLPERDEAIKARLQQAQTSTAAKEDNTQLQTLSLGTASWENSPAIKAFGKSLGAYYKKEWVKRPSQVEKAIYQATKRLVDSGADLNTAAPIGFISTSLGPISLSFSPLNLAVGFGNVRSVELLLEHGARETEIGDNLLPDSKEMRNARQKIDALIATANADSQQSTDKLKQGEVSSKRQTTTDAHTDSQQSVHESTHEEVPRTQDNVDNARKDLDKLLDEEAAKEKRKAEKKENAKCRKAEKEAERARKTAEKELQAQNTQRFRSLIPDFQKIRKEMQKEKEDRKKILKVLAEEAVQEVERRENRSLDYYEEYMCNPPEHAPVSQVGPDPLDEILEKLYNRKPPTAEQREAKRIETEKRLEIARQEMEEEDKRAGKRNSFTEADQRAFEEIKREEENQKQRIETEQAERKANLEKIKSMPVNWRSTPNSDTRSLPSTTRRIDRRAPH